MIDLFFSPAHAALRSDPRLGIRFVAMIDDILSPTAVLRFAPSPNGALHLGHAYSALINERLAGN